MGTPYAEVIGDPIAHSRSPTIHRLWLERLGLDGEYRAVRVAEADLAEYLASRRGDPDWRGCNVTIPHKVAVIDHLDALDSAEIGAVNCIVPRAGGLRGLNTDVLGIADALGGLAAEGPVVLIGAGGAARAALAWIRDVGAADVRIVARETAKAETLLADFGMHGSAFSFDRAVEAMADAGGLLNATPLGMSGFDALPETVLTGLAAMRRGGFVLDMVYAPIETRLLQRSAAAGLNSVDGLAMLIGQARSAFRMFFGEDPPAAADGALRALLAS